MANPQLEKALASLTAKVTEANDNKFTFRLDDLINEVQSEIKLRRYVYGNQVLSKKKTPREAERKIQAMEDVLKLLQSLKNSHIIRTNYTILGHPILIEYHGIHSEFREQRLLDELKLLFERSKDQPYITLL